MENRVEKVPQCWSRHRWSIFLALHLSLLNAGASHSAEKALSTYLPGYYGDYAVAVAPQAGFYGYLTSYNLSASLNDASNNLDLKATALISGGQYVAPEKIGSMTYAFGAYTAVIDARLQGSVNAGGSRIEIDQEKLEQGDTSVSPIILYWSAGNWHFNYYEAVFLPTGKFDRDDPLNLSRNYMSFDSVAGITWLDPVQRLEISLVPGLMLNRKNPSTGYQTGTEFHIDMMFNVYLSQSLAIGLHGYFYEQIEDDQLNGIDLPNIDSRAVAVGASFLWIPTAIGIQGKVVGKWLHDVESKDRFEGDIFSLTGAIQF